MLYLKVILIKIWINVTLLGPCDFVVQWALNNPDEGRNFGIYQCQKWNCLYEVIAELRLEQLAKKISAARRQDHACVLRAERTHRHKGTSLFQIHCGAGTANLTTLPLAAGRWRIEVYQKYSNRHLGMTHVCLISSVLLDFLKWFFVAEGIFRLAS